MSQSQLLLLLTGLSLIAPLSASDNSGNSNANNGQPVANLNLQKILDKIDRKLDTILGFEDKIDEIVAFVRATRDAQSKQTPAQIAKEKQEQALAAADDIADKISTAIDNDDSKQAIALLDAAVAKGFDVNFNPSGRKSQTLLAMAQDEGLDDVVRRLKQLGAR